MCRNMKDAARTAPNCRELDETSLCLTWVKPRNALANQAVLKDNRGDWRKFEPCLTSYADALRAGEPYASPPISVHRSFRDRQRRDSRWTKHDYACAG